MPLGPSLPRAGEGEEGDEEDDDEEEVIEDDYGDEDVSGVRADGCACCVTRVMSWSVLKRGAF